MSAASSYPKRSPFYAMKLIRAMVEARVANEHGSQVYTLLATVAGVEDQARYRQAVTFWDSQLMPAIGAMSQDTLARVTDSSSRSNAASFFRQEVRSRL